MADRFRTFKIIPANTGANTLFTVPTANVAASPPVPVTTFILKTIILHNKSGSGSLDAVMTYSSNAVDYEINNVAVAHQATKIINFSDVYEEGDVFKIASSSANNLVAKVSVLEIKEQQ